MTAASSRQRDLKWIKLRSTKTFSFCPFLSIFEVKFPSKAPLSLHTDESIRVARVRLFLTTVVEIIFGFQSVCW